MNKIINERGDLITDTTDMQRIRRDYSEQLYANKLEKLEKNWEIPRSKKILNHGESNKSEQIKNELGDWLSNHNVHSREMQRT